MSILRGFLIGIGGATAFFAWCAVATGPFLLAVSTGTLMWPVAGLIWMVGIAGATAAVCERFGIDLKPMRLPLPPPPSVPDK